MDPDGYEDEERRWAFMTDEGKYYYFTPDPTLDEIKSLSLFVFSVASRKFKEEKLSSAEIKGSEESVGKIRGLIDSVVEYYRKRAEWRLSEAIMDFNFLSGKSMHMSLRLAERFTYEIAIRKQNAELK